MGDHKEVMQGIQKKQGICYTALTPNIKGYKAAVSTVAEKNISTARDLARISKLGAHNWQLLNFWASKFFFGGGGGGDNNLLRF